MIDRFIIVTRSSEGMEELRWATRKFPRIELFLGSFEEVPGFDCVATAGNSFGLMDAGFDLAVHKYFGPVVQERIQARILEEFLGEQPVGTSFLVETPKPEHRWVAHSPTMRIPMNINGTDNVYLATWATLKAVKEANEKENAGISSLVIPAFGTGTGGISHLEAGNQIRIAIQHFLEPPEYINPSMAQARHEAIHYGGRYGFDHPRPIE